MAFSDYLKNRTKVSESTKNAFSDSNKTTYEKDPREWRPVIENGKGQAVIRFLPGKFIDRTPWVITYSNSFKSPDTGKWYIESNRSTIGEKDPVSDLNSRLWATGANNLKEVARSQRRVTRYISNILVISHPSRPEDEGKVFYYSYGKKLFGKLESAQNPEFADEISFDPFDMIEGANFKLRITTVDDMLNYDKSEFDVCGPISKDEKVLERIYESQYDLSEFVDPKKFKSYAELHARLKEVVGEQYHKYLSPIQFEEAKETQAVEKSNLTIEDVVKAPLEMAPSVKTTFKEEPVVEDDDELTNYFKTLTEGD